MSQASARATGDQPTGHRDVARRLADGRDDGQWVDDAIGHVTARDDLADHHALVLLALVLGGGDDLPGPLHQAVTTALLGFRYWYDEPGDDSMCHWSESHQVAFGVCEHLAGALLPTWTFANDGRTGAEKSARARERLLRWLGNRFRHGFSEWLSPAYLAVGASALALLVDHTADDELRTRASMVLDLLLLDLALHRFDGDVVASAGRAELADKSRPSSRIAPVLASAFGGREPAPFVTGDVTSVFVGRRRYRVPQVVREVSAAAADHLVTTSQGLLLRDVAREVARLDVADAATRRAAAVELYWSMEAFATPEAIGPTMDAIRAHGLHRNHYLAPLAPLGLFRSHLARAAAVRWLNPVGRGAALERADVQTYRTPHYLLSSVQRYRPGTFGDQESTWVAALPGGIRVFSTHPGSTLLDPSARPRTPSAWVGNGVLPDVAQVRNVLLVQHDVRGRPGYLEGRRHELSHLWFPAPLFDETRITGHVVAGRRDDSYIGIVALGGVEMASATELVQRGNVTGWAVLVADRSDFRSLHHLVEHLRASRLCWARGTLRWDLDGHRHDLAWGGDFTVDGEVVDTDYARLRSDWTAVARRPSVVEVAGRTGTLVLDWPRCTRIEEPGRPMHR